jgi:hypothetical protein
MRAFLSSLVLIGAITALAAVALDSLEMSSEAVYSSGAIRH